MSDSSRSTDDAPGNAERLLKALGGVAAGMATRETLTELGDRARGIVEELARSSRSRRREAAPASEPIPEGAPLPQLHHRLDQLRACIGEVADVLDSTVERLETIEMQLGDPDTGSQRQLAEGLERCERVLMGIEYRVTMRMGTAAEPPERAAAPTVLVVAASSDRRAALCLAIERQGFRALAATDLGLALKTAARATPEVALLVVEGSRESRVTFMEEWKECEEQGILPPAAVLDTGGGSSASTLGFVTIREDHGEAAMVASLAALASAGGQGVAEPQ